jgi:hypothetical protein
MTAVAAVLALLLAKELLTRGTRPDAYAPVVRFPLAGDASLSVITGATRPFAVSPDGRTIVFRGLTAATTPHLWVRTIGDPQARGLRAQRRLNRPFLPMARLSPFSCRTGISGSCRLLAAPSGTSRPWT